MGSLRFHALSAPAPLPWRVEETNASSGRRLSVGGQLSGALHTLGYFSTQVCLGSPGRPFDVIIDSGSGLSAVPCAACTSCGKHICGLEGRFDPASSTTASPVGCAARESTQAGVRCDQCLGAQCSYSVHYTEGSSIRGRIVRDVVHMERVARGGGGGRPSTPVDVSVFFGCQTHETGMFQRQRADGILGLQARAGSGRVPSWLTALAQQTRSTNAFSICLSDTGGLFLLGGSPIRPLAPRLQWVHGRRAAPPVSIPLDPHARALFSLRLRQILIEKQADSPTLHMHNMSSAESPSPPVFVPLSGFPSSSLNPTIVDSGTTFLYASAPVHHALLAALRPHMPSVEKGAKLCSYFESSEQLARLMPRLQIVFDAIPATPLTLEPRHYMVEFPKAPSTLSSDKDASNAVRDQTRWSRPRHLCAAIFNNGRGGTVFGASILRHREVIFDLDANTISFVDADCDTARPEQSMLDGAYAFSACERANVAQSTPNAWKSILSNARGVDSRDRPSGAIQNNVSNARVRSRLASLLAIARSKEAVTSGISSTHGNRGFPPGTKPVVRSKHDPPRDKLP